MGLEIPTRARIIKMIKSVIEYVLCYSTAYFLGLGSGILIWAWITHDKRNNSKRTS